MTESVEYHPFAAQMSNVYLAMLALFCFKLSVKITLAIFLHTSLHHQGTSSPEFCDCDSLRLWSRTE
uniref:Uncharacterized protein n=1 Tax=Denticeps clupeoides TaxID=299321 RepID=A0AAY4CGB8_9TELE